MADQNQFNIALARHPYYTSFEDNWALWRNAYEGGDLFIRNYLQKYSKRETDEDFDNRKRITYLPAFAKEAVNEVKDSIFERMGDISRLDGPSSYQAAINGLNGGVDNEGTDMNTFIGQNILPELLVMKCVGVYIDMPSSVNTLLDSSGENHPYIYYYPVEDILNWTFKNAENCREFSRIVLRDYVNEIDPQTGLPTGEITEIVRHVFIGNDGFVHVQFYNMDGSVKDEETILGIKRIPFYLAEISNSLMQDIAKHQVALLNLSSSDIMYALQSNFPFYTEQKNALGISSHLKNPETGEKEKQEISTGPAVGRYYDQNSERPGFIHPSSEPLKASMAKQDDIKTEIRQLARLAVTNLQPKMASAESKSMDAKGLEAGLAYIGLELQRIERLIGQSWAEYEGTDVPTVNYPEKYMLKTDEERWKEAESLSKRIADAPSLTYKKELCKRIGRVMLSGKVSPESVKKMELEIDNAKVIIPNDYNFLLINLQNGVLSTEGAASAQAIPDSEPKNAADEHTQRLARISEAQAPKNSGLNDPAARGVNDLASNQAPQKKEAQVVQ